MNKRIIYEVKILNGNHFKTSKKETYERYKKRKADLSKNVKRPTTLISVKAFRRAVR